ncbi:putative SOS response-associated peptidase YedK [Rhizobium skierniewicense]|uniref:Abasic site processing protein n=1 Tax=Rhizobium skierniewicense TaxID=984260 RepID=A0A7W6CEH3_9HYPH|nr:SOS response-associated peptidase [Rhizobium skierniewicense]MBB3948452.1 putative SOS response-associated peptidase YedK [Rhizobium skierniewicense]
MCGRFTNLMTWAELHQLYSIHDIAPPSSNMRPRYNIAPTQDVFFATKPEGHEMALQQGRWWLVPFFAKELPKAAMFNARIETVESSGAYREPFKTKRCLIPADGYFEWTTNEGDRKKDPWLLQLPDAQSFSFAGLWSHNDKLDVTSCTIITGPAVEHISHIHGRMPFILHRDSYGDWLDTTIEGQSAKDVLSAGQINDQLEFFRVGREVNSSRYDGSDTKKPVINTL